ncbi:amino acid adenylation domain-containing protein [Dictyobacter vulcani]
MQTWNATEVAYPAHLPLYQFFAEQAQRTPDVCAVISGSEEISYAQLDQRTNVLAAYLQERGIGPDVLVGLCMERSLEMIIAILGILKAGGAYVPLDPDYPQERLTFILRDAQVALLLTQESCQQPFVESGVEILCLDTVWPTLTQQRVLREVTLHEDNLAYVIYTSGSTGRPKGVCITHRSAAAFVQWARQRFTPEQLAGVLASTSICFDLSIFEIFVPLSCGGSVILAQNALHLPELPAAHHVTLINTVPSAIAALYRSDGIPASVRCINLAGEPLQHSLVQQLYTLEHIEQIYNLYGPTEDTTYSTWALIERGQTGAVPIGRPIANTQAYLLDQHLRPVPLGVPGELYLGGAGLAQGYFQRPDLTAERFMPNPFGAAGTHLYRTGDLARYTEAGMIEYLGRIDQQIKLRGFRIELGEIEHVLMQHSAVQEAVVIMHQSASETQQLVAYVVLAEKLSPDELREHVQQRVPEYMVPTLLIFLDALPLTPNGKLDRQALHVPEHHRDGRLIAAEPVSPMEKRLLEIWQRVLGEQDIRLHDNFFALGGDSIVSIHIVTQAKRVGIQFTPKQLFSFPTIAELAKVIVEQNLSTVIETEQGLVSGPVALTPIQHWFFDLQLQQQQHWNQAILLTVQQPLDTLLLKQAVSSLLKQHDVLRMTFQQTEHGWLQTSSDTVSTAVFTVVDYSRMDKGEQQARLDAIIGEVQSGLDLLTGPLLRIVYIDSGAEQTARLLLVAHHLVVDAFSWSILLEDLQQAYQQLAAGQTVALSSKTTSFQSWAARLGAYSQSEQVRQELSYWLEMLASHDALSTQDTLPTDLVAGPDSVEYARTVTIVLSAEETQALLSAVPSAYHTHIDDVLLTALAQALTDWTGASSILINREGHGREELFADVDLSRTVGWFTSLMPVRLQIPETGDVIAILKAVKEQLHQMPQHGIGYGLLRYLCQDSSVRERLQALPVPEMVFNYLGQLDQTLPGGSLFAPAPETPGSMLSPQGQRPHLLELNSYIADKRLHMSWTYSQKRHFESTIEALGTAMLQALQSIIQHCQLPDSGGYTPSDFALVHITQEQIDTQLSQYGEIDAAYPLSPLQQGMLFHTMFAPEDGNYVTQIGSTLQGALNIEAFIQAWQQVFQRHPVLRTAFIWFGLDDPIQIVQAHVQVPCVQLDWSDLSEYEQQERLTSQLEEDRLQNFDLTRAPLMRLYLVKLSEDRYQFLWSHHHLLLDGWSIPIVLKDVFMTYEALCQGQTLKAAQPVQSYQQYIRWLQTQKLASAENFWRQALQGIYEPTPLQIGGPVSKSSGSSHRYAEHELQFSRDLTHNMQSLVRQERITLNTLLQGVWALALSRYSGQDAIIFGNVVSGRAADVKDIEEMVGLFINTLPVPVRLKPAQDIRSWLLALQQQQTEMRQYEYSPLAHVQNWSEFSNSTPMFESLFAFENYPLSDAARETEASLAVRDVYSVEQTNYPLNIVVLPGEQLTLKVIYEQNRFEAAAITRLLAHLELLCAGIVADPTQKIASVSMLTSEEQQLILNEWTDTKRPYAVHTCVYQLFEEQAHNHGRSLALATNTQEISYAELNQRTNQLAHYLVAAGVGPDSLVGICMERSIEMIIAMVAVHKAGGAYVPLDPAYPTERLAYMLEDSQVEILLTQQQFASILPECQIPYLFLNREWERLAAYPTENLDRELDSQNLAYMIYTSGSTGLPKGVQITHAGLLNLVFWHVQTYALSAQDRATQLAGVAFDASVWEIWPYLAAGASLHIPDEKTRLSPQELRDWMLKKAITISFLPTPLAERILTLPWPQECALRAMLTGGDKLHSAPEAALPFRLINHYGPTESTVVATAGDVGTGFIERAPAIGKAISNTRIYILNSHLQPVPLGTPGELYIGGVSLARGYWQQPDLTAERFIADPFSQEEGARLYRTGDLVNYLPNGSIDFLSRLDDQVKVLGYRIELGEIESVLSLHATIHECVVIAHEEAGVKYLVAYVVAAPQQQLIIENLRHYLEARLLNYMVPSTFIELEALPLTANGKVDRRALQALASTAEQKERTLVKPRTDVEAKLAALWQQVLGVEVPGIHDNFFALGGDSIVSIQIVARASQIGLQITPKMLFQHPTIAELAMVVISTTHETIIEADQGIVTGEVPLTPIQHWFFEQQQPESWHWNQALLLEVSPDTDTQLLKEVAACILQQHDALRLRYAQTEHGWQQYLAPDDAPVPFFVVDLSTSATEEQPAAIERVANEVQASLDLQRGPIVRFVYLDLGTNVPARLLIVVHHLAIDGVSWRILLEDVRNIYDRLSKRLAVQLPEKTTSVQQWAQKLVTYAQSAALRAELAYWTKLEHLSNSALPVDYERTENSVASARHVEVALSVDETRALLHEVPQSYRTHINDVLLTALAQTISGWTQQSTLLLDLEGHGREEIVEHTDLSRTIGWFTSMYPVQLELTANEQPGAAVKHIKEQLRGIPHNGIGYGLLRYLCADEEVRVRMRHVPEADLSFNYLGQFDQSRASETHFALAHEASGQPLSPAGKRQHLIDIVSSIRGGQLQIDWSYSMNIHAEETIRQLAQNYVQALRDLIAHCQLPEVGGYTSSDFPLTKLTQEQIDTLLGTDRQVEAVYPLSPLQQGLLFHTLYVPDGGDYVVQARYTFKGTIQVKNFMRAWQQAIQHHPVLRTHFLWEGLDQPLQVVRQHAEMPLLQHDWRHLSTEQRQKKLSEYMQADRRQGFDLSRSPLMRVALLQTHNDQYECIWSHHHLLLDGWSLPLVLKDVFDSYEAFQQGREIQLQRSRAYQDYIAWVSAQPLQQAESFWKHLLADFIEPTHLSFSHRVSPTNEEKNASYAVQTLELSTDVTQALQRLVREQGLTLNTLVQGAWVMLLSHFSGQQDVVFGSVVSGRPSEIASVESMVGLFINTLPVRVRIRPEQTLLNWLQAIQAQVTEMRQYEYTPLVHIQGWSEIERGMNLFESLFIFENYPLETSEQQQSTDLQILDVQAYEQTNYPLTVFVLPGESLKFKLVFEQQQFAVEQVQHLLQHLQQVLEQMLARPDQHLGQLPLLSASEQQHIVREWNTTRAPYAVSCIHQLIEAQVERTPTAQAILFEEQALTYRELNERANQFAHHLQSLGVGPDIRVGLYLERSLEMMVAVLGVLKVGGAYVPLDLAYPQERIAYMMVDSGMKVIVTQEHLRTVLPTSTIHMCCLDTEWETIAQNPVTLIDTVLDPQNAAYAIYTSGSTGQPKGVLVPHQTVANFAAAMLQQPGISDQDVCLAMTTLSFDISVLELLVPLMVGAKVIVTAQGAAVDGDYIAEILETAHVTLMQATPATWRVLQNSNWTGKKDVKLLSGGEGLPQDLANFLLERSAELWNMYGPTETTIWSSICKVEKAANNALVSIGRPISNTQLYVLDSALRPVPIGVAGELYIAGDGVVDGYIDRPELTAERFIANPFGEQGTRMYRTGDVASYQPNGSLLFLGRSDYQVKVRGRRIELGEIESALKRYPMIRESVVIVREDLPGNQRLVAYIVCDGAHPTLDALRQHLVSSLPEYMLPASFMFMDALPLTANGKLNRRALPIPDVSRPELGEAFVAPRNALEKVLVQQWSEILQVEHIGIHDNFFALGGHSLLATQLTSRLSKIFQMKLPLRSIFEAATIAEMATVLVKHEKVPGQVMRVAEFRQKIASMSPEEVRAALQSQGRKRK